MKRMYLLFVLLGMSLVSMAQDNVDYTPQDLEIYKDYMKWVNQFEKQTTGSLMVKTAKYFRGKPYLGGTLEREDETKLVVNLREFDCTTFVETCLALSKTVLSRNKEFSNFCDILRQIRYRGGVMDGYSSRLHYMTDWVYDNQKMGIVKDITGDMGGYAKRKKINYLSSHATDIKQLKDNQTELDKMKGFENAINERDTYVVLKYNHITEKEWKLSDGDIVLFTSAKGDLDYQHVGIVYKTLHGITFIHASSKEKEVFMEKQAIRKYVNISRGGKEVSFIHVL